MTDNLIAKQNLSQQQLLMVSSEMNNKQKSKGVGYALWFFLGALGAHRFYSGNVGYAICMLLFGWATCFIWNLVDVFFIGKAIEKKNQEMELKIINELSVIA
jgi:TM2 domain-containing membrane protein YozV